MSLPRLLQAAESVTDPALGRWLRYAAQRLRDGATAAEALALDGGSAALDQRDFHLRRAAAEIDGDLTAWQAAGRLVAQLRYLHAHPELSRRYPDLAPPLRELVAAQMCGPVPSSQRQLHRCLSDSRGGSLSVIAVNTATAALESEHDILTATG